jgi:hypothetical protein
VRDSYSVLPPNILHEAGTDCKNDVLERYHCQLKT